MAGLQPLFTSDAIAERLETLAGDIASAMPKDFAAIAILKGSFVFAADLIRSLIAHDVNPEVDFMTLASYGTGTVSSGEVKLLRDVEIPVAGREVLLIDDILDSGRTVAYARRHMLERGAKAVKVCVLLDKTSGRDSDAEHADFVGFPCPPAFVVGYGMDHAHKFRGLPFIAVLSPS
ncbi:MAG: hypoxanthine phosphoribosyltransferase [Alphaproteobacteria bacterium]|nr:hypoxanthine phosphoribosyltransferase [Alphaproteobacteria bacterium]